MSAAAVLTAASRLSMCVVEQFHSWASPQFFWIEGEAKKKAPDRPSKTEVSGVLTLCLKLSRAMVRARRGRGLQFRDESIKEAS